MSTSIQNLNTVDFASIHWFRGTNVSRTHHKVDVLTPYTQAYGKSRTEIEEKDVLPVRMIDGWQIDKGGVISVYELTKKGEKEKAVRERQETIAEYERLAKSDTLNGNQRTAYGKLADKCLALWTDGQGNYHTPQYSAVSGYTRAEAIPCALVLIDYFNGHPTLEYPIPVNVIARPDEWEQAVRNFAENGKDTARNKVDEINYLAGARQLWRIDRMKITGPTDVMKATSCNYGQSQRIYPLIVLDTRFPELNLIDRILKTADLAAKDQVYSSPTDATFGPIPLKKLDRTVLRVAAEGRKEATTKLPACEPAKTYKEVEKILSDLCRDIDTGHETVQAFTSKDWEKMLSGNTMQSRTIRAFAKAAMLSNSAILTKLDSHKDELDAAVETICPELFDLLDD